MSNLAPTIHRSRGLDQKRRPTFHIIQSPPFGLSPIATRPTMLLKMVCKMAKRVTNGDNNQPRTIMAQRCGKVSCFPCRFQIINEKKPWHADQSQVGNPTAAVMRRTWRSCLHRGQFNPTVRNGDRSLMGDSCRPRWMDDMGLHPRQKGFL